MDAYETIMFWLSLYSDDIWDEIIKEILEEN